ncbi:hypothetical protein HYC85_009496 [Camellia sinensis]|uniref:Uncharacterized protein n=1 Tax=Camellia sinensis TaxID=4442 RepID=A0A7J7HF48_CAMSI|nr:hypothetical protein HYC85_009496 [Camellia sinensis]
MAAIAAATADTSVNLTHTAKAAVTGGGNYHNRYRNPPDWQDFVGIITLFFINSTISFIEENNARNAAAALMGCLAPKAKVLRDGKWSGEDVVVLIPGDVGEIEAVVIATGVHTFFGKVAHLVDSTNQVGHFQKVFARGVDGEVVVLMAVRASRDAIDAAIVGTLADPKEAPASIQEVHFLPFNLTDKRTSLTYIDSEDKFHNFYNSPKQVSQVSFILPVFSS